MIEPKLIQVSGILMSGYDIKFKFDIDYLGKEHLDRIFKIIGNSLNIQFDENFNPYPKHIDTNYIFKDVSNHSFENIKLITDAFFDFSFKDFTDIPLYKFLVLKNTIISFNI